MDDGERSIDERSSLKQANEQQSPNDKETDNLQTNNNEQSSIDQKIETINQFNDDDLNYDVDDDEIEHDLNGNQNDDDDLYNENFKNNNVNDLNENSNDLSKKIEDDTLIKDTIESSNGDIQTVTTSLNKLEIEKNELEPSSTVNNEIKKSNETQTENQSALPTKSTVIIVHLLNGGLFECPITSKSTGKDVFRSTCDYLILREHQFFGLTYRDAENTRIWVNLDKKITKQIKDNPNSVHFEVKFFPEPTDLKENITRFFLCLQIRNNMIEEKITCSHETYAILGSYLVQSEFGDFNEEKHGLDYLNNFKFAPKPTEELIERLKELHKERKGLLASEAELAFLQNAKKFSIYGLDFYPAKDSTESNVTIGVCSSGLSVYNKESICIEKYPWLKINKISYNLENFCIRVKPSDDDTTKNSIENGKSTENTVDFKLCSAKAAHDLWKITVEHHTFFKTLSSNNQTSKLASSGKHSSKKTKSKSSKHKKDDKSSKHHKSERSKNKKENLKSSTSGKRSRKAAKSEKSEKSSSKHQLENRKEEQRIQPKDHRETKETRDKHLKESTRNNYYNSSDHRHSSSNRHKRRRDEDKSYSRDEERKHRAELKESNRELNNRDRELRLIRESRKEDRMEDRRDERREVRREDRRDERRDDRREERSRRDYEHHHENKYRKVDVKNEIDLQKDQNDINVSIVNMNQ